ncbi:MAG: trypsin-like serine protease [Planctomycetaceae bacterium]
MHGTIGNTWSKIAAAVLGAVLLLPAPARGVIIDTLDGSGNTSAPGDDPGWANLGTVNNGSAVYLGNRWVLTANHVGSGSTTLSGTTYAAVPGSNVIITNNGTPGRTANTDLLMYRLATNPGLPALTIAATTPQTADPVTLIGAGRDRGAFQTWFVNVLTTPYTWTVDNVSPNAAGYFWGSTRTMRWGTNAVSGSSAWIDYNPGFFVSAYTFTTTFDDLGGPSTEAQAAVGDSGGAVFFKNGASWELGGIMLAVDAYSGQPAGTAVFGNNTYAADLSFYRSQIVSIVPEPSAFALAIAGVVGGGLTWLRRRR